jgi:hypothetical protein
VSRYQLVSPADQNGRAVKQTDDGQKMTDDELQQILHGLVSDCVTFTDGELSPDRAEATEYYLGKPLGNEEPGRSQIVLTEVRDAVQGALPQLLKVFFGPEQQVEFVPRSEAQVQEAEQATDYVQYVWTVDNPGFLLAHSVLLDGLVRKLGIFKWGWTPDRARTYKLEGLTQSQMEQYVANDPDVEPTRITPCDEATSQEAGEPCFDVELTHIEREGRANIWAVPPDEFLYTRESKDIQTALMVAHRTEKTRGELMELGIKKKDLDEYGNRDASLESNLEEQTRREAQSELTAGTQHDPEAGAANAKILYIEAFPFVDFDGDGVAELRRICMVGPTYHVVSNEPVDSRPFAIYCPSPEPHTITGQSWADRVKDLQRIKTAVLRATLDSAAASIFPRTWYVEGQAAVEDILNTEIGGPIRTRAPGMVGTFDVPFLGREMLPVLEYLDEVREARTGQDKGAIGLDADSLQSSTKTAVGAAVSAAQAQTELLARIFAEMTLKPLFRGILKLLVEHQPRARVVRLRNKWVPIDPRSWDANMDVAVNVTLGSGFKEEKIATLLSISEKQEAILSSYGPSNPITTVSQYANTLARMIKLQGLQDTHSFVNDVPKDWQPPQTPPPPSPEIIAAQTQLQIEQIRSQREMQIHAAEMQLKQQQQAAQHEIELKKLADDFTLRLYQINAQFGREYTEQQLETDATRQDQWLEGAKTAHAAVLDQRAQAHQHALNEHQRQMEVQQQQHEQELAQQQQAHDQQMAERQTAASEQAATART